MAALEFFVPTNRYDGKGRRTHLDGLNELIAAHNRGRKPAARLKRQNGRNAEGHCLAAMREAGWQMPMGKCIVTITFVEVDRRRDPDNIFGGAKFLLDGITLPRGQKEYGAGAIVDDSQRFVSLRLPDPVVDRHHPGAWIRIEEVPDSR